MARAVEGCRSKGKQLATGARRRRGWQLRGGRAPRGSALMNQGPGGKKTKKEKETDTRRSQAITALAAPDLQRPVH